MTLPDLEKHCLGHDPNKPNIAEYLYYITRSQDSSIQTGMSCRGMLALPPASCCSLPTVVKRLYRNILGLINLVLLERRRRESPVLTPLPFFEMLNINMIEPLIQGLGAMVL